MQRPWARPSRLASSEHRATAASPNLEQYHAAESGATENCTQLVQGGGILTGGPRDARVRGGLAGPPGCVLGAPERASRTTRAAGAAGAAWPASVAAARRRLSSHFPGPYRRTSVGGLSLERRWPTPRRCGPPAAAGRGSPRRTSRRPAGAACPRRVRDVAVVVRRRVRHVSSDQRLLSAGGHARRPSPLPCAALRVPNSSTATLRN